MRTIIAFISSLSFLLLGCATFNARSGAAPTISEWKKGNFHVRFQAGPRGRDGRTFSYYEIRHFNVNQLEQELVMESAHSDWRFVGSGRDSSPEEFIRVIADPNGKALLIQEDIPNDCEACSNYLWVHFDSNEELQGEYLQLPSKEIGPPGGINYEFPDVRSLDGDILRYEYSTDLIITKPIGQIEKSNRPTPPG